MAGCTPELLDWLALRIREGPSDTTDDVHAIRKRERGTRLAHYPLDIAQHPWDIKHIGQADGYVFHLSAGIQPASGSERDDPNNRLLAFSPASIEAEFVRE